jgi:hypothetical protein
VRLRNDIEYVRNPFTEFLEANNIELFLDKSKFTNKVNVINRAIRTIRDMAGENPNILADKNVMDQVVEAYNNRPHAAFDNRFTPLQVQSNPDLEEYFIREQLERLREVKELQRDAGFFDSRPGNVLLIHLNKAKTKDMFDKKRRAFNEVAIFVNYQNGNVLCDRLQRTPQGGIQRGTRVLIPIFYTRRVAQSLDTLAKQFQQLIF